MGSGSCVHLCVMLSQGPAPGVTVVWPPILLLFNGFFFLDLFCYVYDTYMFCLHVCLRTASVPSALRGQKRGSML